MLGRLLLIAAVLPGSPLWYDALVLWLCARTRREAWALTACSWVAGAAMLVFAAPLATLHTAAEVRAALGPFAMAGAYVPALVMVLWRTRDA
jgi:hypothetical protein